MVTIEQVVFQRKSPWQKDDCLFCDNKAILEAVVGEENVISHIRCCAEHECGNKAAELAVEQADALLRPRK